ncbi:MAG: hypothetical protein CM1200mP41_35370 [Gammaproteobacteria bacterium]|nr:MAG: hypothetical protein CM1200mP41_35370 [Gammaproteobacteria bacterium]
MAVPDVLLIDGGRGQLNVAVNVLNELSLGSVRVVGVARVADESLGVSACTFRATLAGGA